jgi:tRNA-specific 2-thiouridylase
MDCPGFQVLHYGIYDSRVASSRQARSQERLVNRFELELVTEDIGGRSYIDGSEYLLKKGLDEGKDQSYFLYALTQEQISRIRFPLGHMSKEAVRTVAEEQGFRNARKRDSQDICFIPDGDYVGFIERNSDLQPSVGNFVDCNGNILGQHLGHLRYTVGQRKGLGIAFGVPTYVCAKDAASNTVTLGSNEDLFRRDLTAHSINLISCERLEAPTRVLAKVRYKAAPAPAVVEQLDDDRIAVRFDEPQRAICPGQSVVLYDGEYVLGGGVID